MVTAQNSRRSCYPESGLFTIIDVGDLASLAESEICRLLSVAVGDTVSEAELAKFRALAERSLEDHRGIDVSQIRDRLRLTPAQRVDRLVNEVKTWGQIRDYARDHHA